MADDYKHDFIEPDEFNLASLFSNINGDFVLAEEFPAGVLGLPDQSFLLVDMHKRGSDVCRHCKFLDGIFGAACQFDVCY